VSEPQRPKKGEEVTGVAQKKWGKGEKKTSIKLKNKYGSEWAREGPARRTRVNDGGGGRRSVDTEKKELFGSLKAAGNSRQGMQRRSCARIGSDTTAREKNRIILVQVTGRAHRGGSRGGKRYLWGRRRPRKEEEKGK